MPQAIRISLPAPPAESRDGRYAAQRVGADAQSFPLSLGDCLPPFVPRVVRVARPNKGATDQDHPDQIARQPMNIRCLGHYVHIFTIMLQSDAHHRAAPASREKVAGACALGPWTLGKARQALTRLVCSRHRGRLWGMLLAVAAGTPR
jgi:hypothetical protein